MKNNSIMKCCVCNNEKIGQFITIDNEKYHLCCIKQLKDNWTKLKDYVHKDTLTATEYVELNKDNELLMRYNQALLKENNELKKQLGNIEEELELVRCDLHNRTSERDGSERELNECLSQQKEFIKHLEDEIQKKSKKATTLTSFKRNVVPLMHCLQKYKEIIGVSDEK